ncbi:hypothetical protein KCP69_22910 [Salmonella enterica subsp. enterica]|nr:hypothetical protein KCP69_22910 [Salmonella enterica subsp. enterica]
MLTILTYCVYARWLCAGRSQTGCADDAFGNLLAMESFRSESLNVGLFF